METRNAAAPSTVRVRAAVPADVFSVAALHIQCEREFGHVPGPGFLDEFADAWLADDARVTLLAEDETHRPLGLISAALVRKLPSPRRPRDRWAHVSLLYVTRDARGAGLGEQLLRSFLDWCRAHEVTRVQLHAEEAARGLYARVGFGPAREDHREIALG